MGFIDKLLDQLMGKPTLASIAEMVKERLCEVGVAEAHIETDLGRGLLSYKLNSGSGVINISNMLRDASSIPRSKRKDMVARLVPAAMETDLPSDYATAQPTLRPVIRTLAEVTSQRMRVESMGNDRPENLPRYREFVPGLVVLLVLDRPDTMLQVTGRQLEQWGVSFEQALEHALDNLRNMPGDGEWAQMEDGVWAGAWADSYESSRLLMPDMIYRLGISDPVALVPFRNYLLVTEASNKAGIERISQIAQEGAGGGVRWLSFEFLKLEGKTWRVWEEQTDSLDMMRLQNLQSHYAEQKELLASELQRRGEDVHLATFSAMESQEKGVFSYAVWTRDCDTLLPKADLVVFVELATESAVPLPWKVVEENFGHLWEKTDHYPVLYRTRQSPDVNAIARLAQSQSAI